jgi:hypothetical protein
MITKRFDGWYYGTRGPFATKQEAVANSVKSLMSTEKHQKGLVYCIDYHHTYETDPKLWNSIINLFWLRKDEVICISRDHNGKEDEILNGIGKVIGKENVYFTKGQAKQDFAKDNNLKVDIWIDDNPKHILEDD